MHGNDTHEHFVAARTARGNMLFMCIGMLAVVLLVACIAFGVYFLLISNKQLQNCSEDIALQAAQQLNLNDYAGRINNLIGRSRELVYTSREIYRQTRQDHELSDIQQLAAQVVDQSRSGALLVNRERARYVAVSISNLRHLLQEAREHHQRGIFLPAMASYDPQITDLMVGSMANQPSNVEPSSGVTGLIAYDRTRGYIKPGNGEELYFADVNLKLPEEDADLDFVLSPLPAPVDGTSSPMRLSLGHYFKATLALRNNGQDTIGTCKLSPSVVQVVMNMKVREEVIGEFKSSTKTVCTACTNGASQEP